MDNIFTALVHEKTSGVILEFILWCTVCFAALMSLVALAIGGGEVTWILFMLFSAGLAVLMAFRLKAVAMLYSVGVFYFVVFLIHYLRFSFGYTGGASRFPLNIILFVLTLMLALAVVICAFVHFFTRYSLGTLLTVLVLSASAAIFLLQILLYASDYSGDYSYVNEYHRVWMNYRGYWVGTVSFWLILAAVAVFYACFFWGPIDSRKGKIYVAGQNLNSRMAPGIQGLSGSYAGRMVYLQGGELTLGSGTGVSVVIPDGYVSSMHCRIRFNASTGFYEVMDQSSNGVWLSNGMKLQKGIYNSVRRGSVICIGSSAQQFRLV